MPEQCCSTATVSLLKKYQSKFLPNRFALFLFLLQLSGI
ncbi:hypothetical protein D1AOALGA4SA_6831 [Olavius algarvensis Delta 1 endosymbiont]|nr:hypothetical protein D1AOALGA4SA_6831 [Olavius algarvensis Delta 1 endosymbiont]